MEFIKTENIKEEVTDRDILSRIKVSSDTEYTKQKITSYDEEISTEKGIKHEIELKEHELSHKQLNSIKIEGFKVENGNEYTEYTAAKGYVSLNILDVNHGQYVNDMEPIKHEKNVEKEDTSNYVDVDRVNPNAIQQCQNNPCKYETVSHVGKYEAKRKYSLVKHFQHENSIERHQSVLVYKAEDKSTSQTHKERVKYFKCHFCKCIKKSVETLKRHFTVKHNENAELYHCLNCEYKTKVKKDLIRHCTLQHNKIMKWYQCHLCDYKTKYRNKLLQHHTLKHDDAAEVFHCEQCAFKTKYKHNFLFHRRIKHDDGAKIFDCELCEFKTKCRHTFLRHHRLKHDDSIEVFPCALCNFKTKSKRNLLLHHRLKHDDTAEIFHCELCSFKTKSKQNFLQHHRRKHDDSGEIFQCEVCYFKTKYKGSLLRHHRRKHDNSAGNVLF